MRIQREVKTHGPGPGRLDLRRSERRSERPLNRSCCRCAPTDTHGGFPFARRRRGAASAPRCRGRWREAGKFGVFAERFVQFLLIKSLTKRKRAAILYPEPEESSSPSRGAAPLEYRFSGIDGGESDVLNRPEADRVL